VRGEPISEALFGDLLASFERSAFRLELQPAYSEPCEHDTVQRFLAGRPQPPTEVPELREWFGQVSRLTRAGRTVQRVRVHEHPPTDYQRWERWIGQWNAAAGEHIRYMTRQQAHDAGLLPAAGSADWWLIDEDRLIVMRFDDGGRRLHTELVADRAAVTQACEWRDLAVRYSAPDEHRAAAA
jgi:hypothetical protein